MRPTICLPTYNRGTLAVQAIQTMRETLTDVDYFVLDNASTEDTFGYEGLELDPDLRYVRLPANTGIHGAFSACLEHNTGVIIFISDEDVIPPEGLEALRGVDWDKVAVARGAITGDPAAHDMTMDAYYTLGLEAVSGYCFQHSVMSGVAYNLHKLEPVMARYHDNLWQHLEYMIFYLDLLACSVGDAQTFAVSTAVAGKPAGNAITNLTKLCAHRPYSLGGRIDQLVAARNGLISVADLIDENTFLNGLVKAMAWSIRMVGQVNGQHYQNGGIDRGFALLALRDTAYGIVHGTKGLEPYEPELCRLIDDMVEAYL